MDVIVGGGGGGSINIGPLAVPALLVTVIVPGPASAGAATTSLVAVALIIVAATPLNSTVLFAATASNFVPVMVTVVPPVPDVGLTAAMVIAEGAATGATF